MANAKIDVVGPGDTAVITQMYNQVFKPSRDAAFIDRRFAGRTSPLCMVATIDDDPIGFSLGFELKPGVLFLWLVGVLPDMRRSGIGSQLLDATEAWAREHDYRFMRFECANAVRPMLHMAIAHGYDIAGIRWDGDLGTNLVICERSLDD